MIHRLGRPVPGWMGAKPLSPTVMVGRRVVVSPIEPDHVAGLWEAFSEAADGLWDYLPYGPFATQGAMRRLVESWVGATDPMFFVFVVDDRPRGWGAHLRSNPEMGTVEIGHLAFSPRLRESTAATEAMYLMARRAFDELGYRRYEWKCDDLNEASRRAAERLGFTYEGTFRHHMVYKGRNRDTAWYAITDDEWPAIRAAFERWLDPANFEASGHQRKSLARIRG